MERRYRLVHVGSVTAAHCSLFSRHSQMEAEDERSGLHRMGSMAVTLAIVPLVVGFATEHWLEADMRSVGLWKFCNDVACRPLQSDDVPGNH